MLKTLALSLIFSLAAHAAPAPSPTPSPSPTPGYGDIDIASQCPELKLTQAQIEQSNTIKVAAVQKLKAQKAQFKEAKSTLLKSLGDANATQEVVTKNQQAVRDSVNGILDTVFETANQMVFQVLTKEQRQPGIACFQKVQKDMRKKWLERRCAARQGGGETEESEVEIDNL